jgi:hypothetical protein
MRHATGMRCEVHAKSQLINLKRREELEDLCCSCDDNIKTDRNEIALVNVGCIRMTQDSPQCHALLNTTVSTRVV